MTQPPEQFRALVADKDGDDVRRSLTDLSATDLPDGEVTIKVGWSSVNYKDALAATGKGRILRRPSAIGGIDFAGTGMTGRFTNGYNLADLVGIYIFTIYICMLMYFC